MRVIYRGESGYLPPFGPMPFALFSTMRLRRCLMYRMLRARQVGHDKISTTCPFQSRVSGVNKRLQFGRAQMVRILYAGRGRSKKLMA